MHQQTLAEEGFERYRKPTRRKRFLEEKKTFPSRGRGPVSAPPSTGTEG